MLNALTSWFGTLFTKNEILESENSFTRIKLFSYRSVVSYQDKIPVMAGVYHV